MPRGVSTYRTLKKDIKPFIQGDRIDTRLQSAWERLKSEVRTDRAARREHLAGITKKHGKSMAAPIGVGFLVVAAVWILVLWLA